MYRSPQPLTFAPQKCAAVTAANIKTLTDLWGLYQAENKGRSAEKRRERAAMFAKHIEPGLGAMALSKITQAHIVQLLGSLENLHVAHARQQAILAGKLDEAAALGSKPLGGQRNRVLSLLSAVFRFALVRGLMKRSPIIQASALSWEVRERVPKAQTIFGADAFEQTLWLEKLCCQLHRIVKVVSRTLRPFGRFLGPIFDDELVKAQWFAILDG
jgi:hypothetical protein